MIVPHACLRPLRAACLSCLSALLAAGCASDGFHYSQIVGDRFFKTNLDTFPVTIAEVDDRSYLYRYPILVEPGLRRVVVEGPPAFVDLRSRRHFALQVAPCTRYYLVAVKPNRLVNDFDVRVDFEEPIAGCRPPRS